MAAHWMTLGTWATTCWTRLHWGIRYPQGFPATSALSGGSLLPTNVQPEGLFLSCNRGMKGAPAAHLLSKAHLQQAVSFIQHQSLQVLQAHRLGVPQVVNEAPLQPVAAPYWPAASSHMVLTAFDAVVSSVIALSHRPNLSLCVRG